MAECTTNTMIDRGGFGVVVGGCGGMTRSRDMYATKFEQLFYRGRHAVLSGTHDVDRVPANGTARWGISVILPVDPTATAVLDMLATEALAIAGSDHWPTGARASSHVTVRSLEAHRDPIDAGDAAVARYGLALERTAKRCRPVRFALTGITLTPIAVMACIEPIDTAADELAMALAEELGADAWREANFDRDIWYATLVHFTGPIEDPGGLVDWVVERRRTSFGMAGSTEVELIRWTYDGHQVQPVRLSLATLAGPQSSPADGLPTEALSG